jgi:hypothetical protein
MSLPRWAESRVVEHRIGQQTNFQNEQDNYVTCGGTSYSSWHKYSLPLDKGGMGLLMLTCALCHFEEFYRWMGKD